ncbi:hypothetical protein HPB51_007935 [Rhipicephalus microplus]|uniref:Peptidase M13 N-terminal domain-containing protein n=1 Tax=Rhipicephalus microplus TaxID=6941 RepID=A0A9J6EME9_RHIMP|nr:hypothetical protein HPB51_007935 [Rhipicephalus microplus]
MGMIKKSALEIYRTFKQEIAKERIYDNTRGSSLLFEARTGVLRTKTYRAKYEGVDTVCTRRFDDIVEHATVSACVDFYEHTCAYWREANPIPDYAWRHSYMDRIRMNIEADVRDALKAESRRRARTITTGLVATMIDIYRGCISKLSLSAGWPSSHTVAVVKVVIIRTADSTENPEKSRKTMSDLDLALFHGNNHLVSQALIQLVLQFDVDAFFRVRFLRSQFAYPREYLELDFPSLVIRPENLLQKGAVLKEADRRLLHEATLEVYDALRLHPAPERRARAEKVVDVVKAVTTRILNLRATAVNNPVAFRRVSDFGGAKVVDWHTFFSEVTHHSMSQLRFTMVKLVNSYYLLDISPFIDSLAEHAFTMDPNQLAQLTDLLLSPKCYSLGFGRTARPEPECGRVGRLLKEFAHLCREETERAPTTKHKHVRGVCCCSASSHLPRIPRKMAAAAAILLGTSFDDYDREVYCELVTTFRECSIQRRKAARKKFGGDTVALADYLRLLLFLHFATALPSLSKITEAYWRFAHDLRQEPERWRLCLYFIDDVLPRSLSWFYHHYHLTLRVAKEGSVADHLSTVTALKEVFAMFLANTAAAPFNMRADGAAKITVLRAAPTWGLRCQAPQPPRGLGGQPRADLPRMSCGLPPPIWQR